ncbi:MAG: RusA family crossover junction endodeoxyribonuclease [Alphaproteobacteria bacterium]|nr:RusA family crossover junction endodeoxyribonuclease [Alphaproteobacteria bacterium]
MHAAASKGSLNLRVDAVTAGSDRFNTLIGAFFASEFKRPREGAFEIVVEIERAADAPAHDVDQVAKAVLDSLSGVVFRDGSRIERLHVEKTTGDRARVKVRARPIRAPEAA